jgi:hypothetical protein
MTPVSTLAIAVGIALLASTLTVFAILEPLRRQLDASCPSGTSASFWTRTAVMALYLLPLFVVLVFGLPDLSRVDMTPAETVRRTIAAAAFALAAIVIGLALRLASRRQALPSPPRAIER